MKKNIVLFPLLLTLAQQAVGQQTPGQEGNTEVKARPMMIFNVYVSALTRERDTPPFVLSSEQVVQLKGRSFLAARIGFGYWKSTVSFLQQPIGQNAVSIDIPYDAVQVPLNMSYILTSSNFKHGLETGLQYIYFNRKIAEAATSGGYNLARANHNELSLYIGYRYQRPQGGFFFKIGAGFRLVNFLFYANYQTRPDLNDKTVISGGSQRNWLQPSNLELSIGWSFSN